MSFRYDPPERAVPRRLDKRLARPFRRIRTLVVLSAGLGVASVGFASGRLSQTPEFTAAMNTAMDSMMMGMDASPSGDVDKDFVAMMVPHHQGAIDMAIAELRFGKDVQLKRIAQEIIVDQQQEIAAMRLALGQPLPPSAPAPTGSNEHPHMRMEH